jgi:hypothetical protein
MDASQFDALSKRLGTARSRRSLLGAALAAAAASLGRRNAEAAARCRGDGGVCTRNADCCGGYCAPKDKTGRRYCAPQCLSVQDCPPGPGPCQPAFCDGGICGIASPPDYASDLSNCGGCGTVCPTPPSNGYATGASGACGIVCDEPLVNCGAVCVDLQSDAANCGSCGASCSPGLACCGGGCFDTQSDIDNCGACGNVCRAGETCSAGACVCGSGPRCPANEVCASGACVDACAPDGTAKCQADCGFVIGTSCYAGPESAVCVTGGGAEIDVACQHDADCAQFSDPTQGYVGLCVERIYGSSITDLSSGDYGYCIQVQGAICQPG